MHTKWKAKYASVLLLLLPAIGLATPASAAPVRPVLSNSQEPGSVIIFPFFAHGPNIVVDGVPQPLTTIEVGVVCPPGALCRQNQAIRIHFDWVCPGFTSGAQAHVCAEDNFEVVQTVGGKTIFDADGGFVGGDNIRVTAPPCPNGFLIGWVVDAFSRPVKFDGLIGDVELRGNVAALLDSRITTGVAANALATYSAIPVQADPALPNVARIVVGPNNALIFDGQAGHYTEVTGQIQGDVKYDVGFPVAGATGTDTAGFLVLLTLDVKSNDVNSLTRVDLDFFSEKEFLASTATNFYCWEAVELQSLDTNLTAAAMGTRRGLYISDQATNGGTQATLLGLNLTLENPVGERGGTRAFTYPTFNNSVGVPTTYFSNDHGFPTHH